MRGAFGILVVVIGLLSCSGVAGLEQYHSDFVWVRQLPCQYAGGDPAIGDLNNDGYLDVVHGSFDPFVTAISGKDGRVLWMFTVSSAQLGPILIDDLNGDGLVEVVFGDDNTTVYCISGPYGSVIWKREGFRCRNSVALYDVNGDGTKDVIAVGRDAIGGNQNLTAFDGVSGKVLWVSPATGNYYVSPQVRDMDGDGNDEIISWNVETWVVNAHDGSVKWRIPTDFSGAPTIVADVNSDGVMDVIGFPGQKTKKLKCYTLDLEALATNSSAPPKLLWEADAYFTTYDNMLLLGDVNGDGEHELLHIQQTDGGRNVICRRPSNAKVLWNVSLCATASHTGFALGDCDNDGLVDLVVTSNAKEKSTMDILKGLDGSVIMSVGIDCRSSPAIADVNNDGKMDIIVNGVPIVDGQLGSTACTLAIPTGTVCPPGAIAWPFSHYDVVNSGILPIVEASVPILCCLLGLGAKLRVSR